MTLTLENAMAAAATIGLRNPRAPNTGRSTEGTTAPPRTL